ncbi:hypothetical protein ACLB2K_067146 [Fragaria x ananassa]
MDLNDTVAELKDNIQGLEPVSFSRLVSHCTGNHRALRECEISDITEIKVSVRSSPTTVGATTVSPGSKNKLKVMVLPKCETKRSCLVYEKESGELTKELQKLHQRLHFHLPQESYFFIYKQNVMDDDKSFRWHHVGQGDTL